MTWTVFVLTIQIERRQCYLGWPNVKSKSNCFKPYTYYLLPLPRLSVEFFCLFLRISFLFNPQSKKHVSLLESSFQEFSTFSTFQKSVSLFWGFATTCEVKLCVSWLSHTLQFHHGVNSRIDSVPPRSLEICWERYIRVYMYMYHSY